MNAAPAQLLDQLQLLKTLVSEFHACLAQESRALAQWPPLALWPVQEEKVRLVRDLESAHDTLNRLLKAHGHDIQGLDSLSPEIAQRWQALREDIAHCQRLNASNERCLAKQQLALRQSLELLVRKLDQDLTYGRQGGFQGGRRLGHIGRA